MINKKIREYLGSIVTDRKARLRELPLKAYPITHGTIDGQLTLAEAIINAKE